MEKKQISPENEMIRKQIKIEQQNTKANQTKRKEKKETNEKVQTNEKGQTVENEFMIEMLFLLFKGCPSTFTSHSLIYFDLYELSNAYGVCVCVTHIDPILYNIHLL